MKALGALTMLASTMLTGCARTPKIRGASVTVIEPETRVEGEWRDIALPADRDRLSGLIQTLDAAKSVTDTGTSGLLDPGRGKPRGTLAPGRYNCRVVRFRGGRIIAPPRSPSLFCFVGVDNDQLTFTQETGEPRITGRLWNDGDTRTVLLGASVRARTATIAYGIDPARSLVGVVERIGDFRWRLIVPQGNDARGNARTDVVELVPLAPAFLSDDRGSTRRRPGR